MCLKADVNSLDLIRTTQIENSLFEDMDRMSLDIESQNVKMIEGY